MKIFLTALILSATSAFANPEAPRAQRYMAEALCTIVQDREAQPYQPKAVEFYCDENSENGLLLMHMKGTFKVVRPTLCEFDTARKMLIVRETNPNRDRLFENVERIEIPLKPSQRVELPGDMKLKAICKANGPF